MIYFLFVMQLVLVGAFFYMKRRSNYYEQTAVMVGDYYQLYHNLSDRAMTVAISYLQTATIFSILVAVALIIPDPWELPAISASAMVSLYFMYGFYKRRLALYKGLSLSYVRRLMQVIRIAAFAFGVLTLAMLITSYN